MGTLFRSEEMTLCQLFLQTESAYSCVSELGELGLIQFRDLNPGVNAFHRHFVSEIKRCSEMERILHFVRNETIKENITIPDSTGNAETPLPREIIDLEATFQKLETDLREANVSREDLKKVYLELTEVKYILRHATNFFEEQVSDSMESISSQSNFVLPASRKDGSQVQLGFLAGVILREKLEPFEKMLWRVCRGNAFLKRADIDQPLEDPNTGQTNLMSVFIIFFQGGQLSSRITKICQGFRASLHPCPETQAERRALANGVMTRIQDLNFVLQETNSYLHRILLAASRNLVRWENKVLKMKAVYHVMNMCNLDVTRKCLIGEGWSAVADLPKVHLALQRGTELSGSSVQSIVNRTETKAIPPTYNKTNKFTRGFQAIVDSYGVSKYREVNPAPFTIITFPFLFAVMFGDFGHGMLMTLFALWMVLKEKNLTGKYTDNEIWMMFFEGRYIILLMGAFSMYTGLIYNDIFSMTINIFGSSWAIPEINSTVPAVDITLDPAETYKHSDHPYPFGLDPIWVHAVNNLLFVDSFKMKTAIILGVLQMLFGVVLSAFNHVYFRNYTNIICEFIPQMIFMLSIFGYLVFLIFYKWVYSDSATSGCSRSILNHFINMFLFSYPTDPCYLDKIYPAQEGVQIFLLLLAVICVPWMWLSKPLYLRSKARAFEKMESIFPNHAQDDVPSSVVDIGEVQETKAVQYPHTSEGVRQDQDEEEPFDFGKLFIEQTIHTIEYCLGSISHTASYLRLWALSLAHAQLSAVLWSQVFHIGLSISATSYYGFLVFYAVFAAWAVLTIAILLIMEGLSAFLHALRLHWVEFQSKFYGGSGHKFIPFSFSQLQEEIINDN